MIKIIVAYLSLLIIVLYVITGYGITQDETITKLTYGILTKSVSFKIHTHLLIPLVIFLLLHLILALDLLSKFKREKTLNSL